MSVDALELEQITDRLIEHIREKPGGFFDHARLAAFLGVDVEILNEAIRAAASWDYKLRVRKSKGVAFLSAPDSLTATEIWYGLKTKWLGHRVSSFQSVKSTNNMAVQLAESGAADGEIVTAEQQTGGRGRLGRSWHSPPGAGIYMSIILRPFLKPEEAPGLSIMAAVALADTMSEYCPGSVQIKWPNDVLIKDRKAAGILTELSADRGTVNHVVIGVGINVNHRSSDFPPELRKIATSLRRVTKHKIHRVEFLQRFLCHLERRYESYLDHRLAKSLPAIQAYSSLTGKEITVKVGRSLTVGVVKEIDADGRLMMRVGDRIVPVTAGEVTIVKK